MVEAYRKQQIAEVFRPVSRPPSAEDLKAHYTMLYKTEIDDSPSECRTSMRGAVVPALHRLPTESTALDLGAGRQIFEHELIAHHGEPPCRIITVDIADLTPEQLLANSSSKIEHIQAAAASLPMIPDGEIALAYSILALDFFQPREKAIAELHRILKVGAGVYLALHNPESLFPSDLDQQLAHARRKAYIPHAKLKHHSEYTALANQVAMRDNEQLFKSADQIGDFFSARGFTVESIDLERTRYTNDKWWKTKLVKQ